MKPGQQAPFLLEQAHVVSLTDYRRKRNFAKTREPAPDGSASKIGRAIFVVQLHHASSRHFDFRLQVGDTLKSWAVPKGPSYDPSVKRLAIEVEDHPVSYAAFEGDIEEGYGKGHVDQFDHGVWSTSGNAEAQLQKGHLEFELFGQRLKGTWHLVRSSHKERQQPWFLIKAKDTFAGDLEADNLLDIKMKASTRKAATSTAKKAAARKATARTKRAPKLKLVAHVAFVKKAAALDGAKKVAPTADFFKPELARLREAPPEGEGWLHEVKWDGYRILTTITAGKVQLWSRNGLPWTDRLPEIVQSLEALSLKSAKLDGELIASDSRGHSDFSGLQKTLSGEAHLPLVYMLFDLPYFEGFDLGQVALVNRKRLLQQVLKRPLPHVAFSIHTIGNGPEAFRIATEEQLEGIVSKKVNSSYHAGRGDDWLKVKRLESDEFAVIGYTMPKGSRQGFGSLLLAKPDPDLRHGWVYQGRVGTGFSNTELNVLATSLTRKSLKKPPVPLRDVDPELRGACWLIPTVVVEIYYRGIGGNHLLRQASLKTFRPDKKPSDLKNSDQGKAMKKKGRKEAVSEITITHPDRVVFANDGITKQQVADYYMAVMDWFLPGVSNRPTSVVRCPEGVTKACFFQKHMIPGLHRVGAMKLKEETGAQAVYLYPEGPASVIELVQFGAIEFHPWGATTADLEQADRLVFDLDPGPKVAWARVVAAARLVRKLLKQMTLESFVRTTGGKGLHVVVPLNPAGRWDMVRSFAEAFAKSLEQGHPLEFVATSAKAKRGGKIYVDYLRNGRGSTSVASYSLRARDGAPVATPLRWEELGRVKSGSDYNITSIPARLARLRKDPWGKLASTKQNLEAVMTRLGKKSRT
jgi:bifunctional non-homologous end joining protein LigD